MVDFPLPCLMTEGYVCKSRPTCKASNLYCQDKHRDTANDVTINIHQHPSTTPQQWQMIRWLGWSDWFWIGMNWLIITSWFADDSESPWDDQKLGMIRQGCAVAFVSKAATGPWLGRWSLNVRWLSMKQTMGFWFNDYKTIKSPVRIIYNHQSPVFDENKLIDSFWLLGFDDYKPHTRWREIIRMEVWPWSGAWIGQIEVDVRHQNLDADPKRCFCPINLVKGQILCYRWFSRDSPLFVVLVHVYLLLIFQNDVAQWNVGRFHHGFSYCINFGHPVGAWHFQIHGVLLIEEAAPKRHMAIVGCVGPPGHVVSWSKKPNRSFLLLKSHNCCCPTSSWFAAHISLFFPILNSFTVYLILSHQFPRMVMLGDKSLVETCYLSIFHHSDIPIFHSATDEDIIRGGTQFSIPTLHGGPTGNTKIPQLRGLRDVQNETGVCPIFLWSRHYSYV